jgi:DNA-binding NarL/FixJ family response regulator
MNEPRLDPLGGEVCRVMLVDEHTAVHHGVAAMLASDPRLALVAHAKDTRAAIDLLRRCRPDVVLVDHDLAGASGLEACLLLKTTAPRLRVVLYCDSVGEDLITMAAVAGADRAIGTETDARTLCETLLSTGRGETSLPAVSPRALHAAASRLEPSDLPIFAMLRHGTAPTDIATTLRTSIRRVTERRRAMLERLTRGTSWAPAPRVVDVPG